jgi:hypothetical protein
VVVTIARASRAVEGERLGEEVVDGGEEEEEEEEIWTMMILVTKGMEVETEK